MAEMASTVAERESGAHESLRVLVTGANGFVGSTIAAHCQRAGMHVSTTGRTLRDAEHLPRYVTADLTEENSLTEMMFDIDAVVHAAGLAHQFDKGLGDAPFMAVNVRGTENAARSAVMSGVKHFVLISSVSVYGAHEESSCDESAACRPHGPYAQSKFEAEQRAVEIFKDTGTCLTILRLATVYGEGDRGNVARLMRAIERGRFLWIGKGTNRKSLIHCDDVARACVVVLASTCAGTNIYNVSAPVRKMHEVVEGLAAALGRPAPRWHIPQSVALSLASLLSSVARRDSKFGRVKETIEKWLADDVYDAQKFEKRFDFEPQVNLEEGLRREVAWHRRSVR